MEWDRRNRCLEGTAFLPCVSYAKTVLGMGLTVRPPVRPSFTLWYISNKNRPTIMSFPPYDSPIILVLGDVNIFLRNSKGITPNGGVVWRWGKKIGDFRPTSWPISRCILEMVEDRRIQPARQMLGVKRAFQRCKCWVFCPRGVPAKIHTMHLLKLS